MKEITKITTIQMTHVEKVRDEEVEEELSLPEETIGRLEAKLKNDHDADDVKVVEVQDFVRDIEEEE